LLDVIDPSVLFRDYIYVTGTSDTIARHNKNYAATIVDYLKLNKDSQVVEVASNDGSLLKCFQPYGVKTLGIEPAVNIAEIARSNGVETVNEFLNLENAQKVRDSHGSADAVIGNNVMAHVDDTQDFLQGCKHLLKPKGLVIIVAPYLCDIMVRLDYDTVYHEHLCYFSITALLRLCDEVGLSIVRVDHTPVHGGSIRMYAGSSEAYPEHAADVLAVAEKEVAKGLTNTDTYMYFARDVQGNRDAVRSLLLKLKERGKTVAGYGAPAKGNTLLNYCGITTDILPYTVDKSPMKVGLYTPGMHLPVLPVETLLEKQPDYVLILAWNFAEEIMQQQSEYQKRGGQFIIPLPEPKIVSEIK
jgi:SAM-dependent methyltransferase